MHDEVADIAGGHEPVRTDLPLHTEVPLVHVGNTRVCIETVHIPVLRENRILIQNEWKWIPSRLTGIRASQTARRADQSEPAAPRRPLSCRSPQLCRCLIVKNSVCGTDHRFAAVRRIPYQPHSRRKLFPYFVHARTSVGPVQRIAWKEQTWRRVQEYFARRPLQECIHVEMQIDVLCELRRKPRLPAQAIGHG